jgi:hypothetical protein
MFNGHFRHLHRLAAASLGSTPCNAGETEMELGVYNFALASIAAGSLDPGCIK